MRRSRYLLSTLKEIPREAESPSHILLLRAGFILQESAGIFSFMPIAVKSIQKIIQIIREEMNSIEGQEISMPVLNPSELWQESGRYHVIGPELIRVIDRQERELVLAMTHEEIVTDIVRRKVQSYRDLPFMLYQFQTKIRDEARPRGGLLRVREFIMKDAYSFHPDYDDLDKYYPQVFDAYSRIFERCGLQTLAIQASSGIMGGGDCHEFMLVSDTGEDSFVICDSCDYKANTETADGMPPKVEFESNNGTPEDVHTPDCKTIESLKQFFKLPSYQFIKTVAYEAEGKIVLAAIRGDLDVNEMKLQAYLKTADLTLAGEDIMNQNGLIGGYISPLHAQGARLICDISLKDATGMIAGANKKDYHSKNIDVSRDFPACEWIDIQLVNEGFGCEKCNDGTLQLKKGIELGHIFKLGTKYTEAMNGFYTTETGEKKPIVMGCYGIGVERLLASIIEASHDEDGIIFPPSIAPFDISLLVFGKKEETKKAADDIYSKLSKEFEVLYDDRNESPGFKFKDADLIGLPFTVVISERNLKENQAEVKIRKTGEKMLVPLSALKSKLRELYSNI